MENVGLILDYIAENENTTQRKISQGTNLALGNINAIIQMCIQKGLIKIERLNSKSLRYILTPKGMIEKSRYAYHYLQASIKRVLTLKGNLEFILANKELRYNQIIFYGRPDDTKVLLKQILEEKGVTKAVWTENFNKAKDLEDTLILVWQPDALQQCLEQGVECLNILD